MIQIHQALKSRESGSPRRAAAFGVKEGVLLFLVAAVVMGSPRAQAQSATAFSFHGFLTAREIYVRSQPSWTEGGFGKFDVGSDHIDDGRLRNVDVAQLGVDWAPTGWLDLHADGLARVEPHGTKGSRAGLLQLYGDFTYRDVRLRLGEFWLPTSRENIERMWTSRYTITYSALNSWIGEEMRPIGADLQYSPNIYLTLGATAFRGNDTMGTELADRGWTFGNRLSLHNEDLPLTLPGRETRPVGRDLDGKNGYAERVRLQLPDQAVLQFTHIDNRATLETDAAYDEEPWATPFNIVAAEIGPGHPTTLAAEWAYGKTSVGFPGGTYTMDFGTVYALVSHRYSKDRVTVRVERFWTRSHERSPSDPGREDGHALTVAWLRDLTPAIRGGAEYVHVHGDRNALAAANLDNRIGGSTVTLELRYAF